jgi:hypothetical protein
MVDQHLIYTARIFVWRAWEAGVIITLHASQQKEGGKRTAKERAD